MPIATDSIGTFAGATGVGALCLLGVFLLLDGRAPNLFPTFEEYAKTATWGVVAAIPVLAIAYVVGLVLLTASGFALRGAFGLSVRHQAADAARLSSLAAKESVLSQTYLQLRQEADVMGGAALALVVLGLGALSETSNLRGLKVVIAVGSAGALFAAVALFWSAGLKTRHAHIFASCTPPVVQQGNHQL